MADGDVLVPGSAQVEDRGHQPESESGQNSATVLAASFAGVIVFAGTLTVNLYVSPEDFSVMDTVNWPSPAPVGVVLTPYFPGFVRNSLKEHLLRRWAPVA